jgi:DNA-binding NtrC family response regulator
METIQSIKQRFEIIGNDPKLNRAIEKAIQVAPTDISVLVAGESGVGKENIPRIIHSLSHRKHGKYIAVNCGAIPEGTIDSELFGHEKGAFTGATSTREGYFEVADGGTIFLDEVGELPLTTQVRLLRVLENGEFIKVGSSQVQKTNVRIVAATNVNLFDAIDKGKFREDLYYRLSTVPIRVPALRDRKEDIQLLFRKFVVDFSERYRTTVVQLDTAARELLTNYPFPGNIRELKNLAEQVSVLSQSSNISFDELRKFLPEKNFSRLPVLASQQNQGSEFANEREILYKLFFDMKKDVTELKKMFLEILQNPSLAGNAAHYTKESLMQDFPILSNQESQQQQQVHQPQFIQPYNNQNNTQPVILNNENIHHHEDVEESLNIMDKEKELIIKALKKHRGKRKDASADLGISERTLYRKLKEYDIEE